MFFCVHLGLFSCLFSQQCSAPSDISDHLSVTWKSTEGELQDTHLSNRWLMDQKQANSTKGSSNLLTWNESLLFLLYTNSTPCFQSVNTPALSSISIKSQNTATKGCLKVTITQGRGNTEDLKGRGRHRNPFIRRIKVCIVQASVGLWLRELSLLIFPLYLCPLFVSVLHSFSFVHGE